MTSVANVIKHNILTREKLNENYEITVNLTRFKGSCN